MTTCSSLIVSPNQDRKGIINSYKLYFNAFISWIEGDRNASSNKFDHSHDVSRMHYWCL